MGGGGGVQGFWVEEVLGVWSLWVLGLGPDSWDFEAFEVTPSLLNTWWDP